MATEETQNVCPRCKIQILNADPALNARSRFHDVLICTDCGAAEAMEGPWK